MRYSQLLFVDNREEYEISLLAYGGQVLDRIKEHFGEDSEEYTEALDRWSDIYRKQTAGWEPRQIEELA